MTSTLTSIFLLLFPLFLFVLLGPIGPNPGTVSLVYAQDYDDYELPTTVPIEPSESPPVTENDPTTKLSQEEGSTSETEPTIMVTPEEGSIPGFNLTFLDEQQTALLSLYGNSPSLDGELCEIDSLLDRVLPPGYEVARNFNLTSAAHVRHINQTFAIFNRIVDKLGSARATVVPLVQRIVTRFSFLAYELQVSPPCMRSLLTVGAAMANSELWAFKFLDASGLVPPNGLLEGVLSSVGDYDECLNIEHRIPSKSNGPEQRTEESSQFQGRYCFARPIIPFPERGSFNPTDKLSNSFGLPKSIVDELVDLLYFMNGSFVNVGLCFPSSCSAQEIETAINTVLYPIVQIPIEIGPECSQLGPRGVSRWDWTKLDPYQRMAIYVLGTLLSVALLASVYELCFVPGNGCCGESVGNPDHQARHQICVKMNPQRGTDPGTVTDSNNNQVNPHQTKGPDSSLPHKPKPALLSRVLLSFSLLGNTRRMFLTSSEKFAVIDFVRLVMLFEIIWMHQYYVALGWSAWPLTKRILNGLFQRVGSDFQYGFLRNIHNTDFFFSLSGLVMAYSILGSLERNKGRFNYLTFALNMYLRFYPAVFGTILLYYLLPLVGDGPFWHLLDRYHVETCRANLAPSLLSYNFYVLDVETFVQSSICNIGTWWVTSCFHLILLSPLLLIPLHHYPNVGPWLVILVGIVGGSLASVSHIWLKGIPYMNAISRMNSIFEEAFYSIFYTWPFQHHISTFSFGIITGYLIRKHPNLCFGGRFGELVMTLICLGLSCLGFYWTQDILKTNIPGVGSGQAGFESIIGKGSSVSDYEVYLNITVGKLMFCTGFMWLFYYCCTKRSERVNQLFNWPGLQPLYSLSLGLYLTNFIPILFTTFSSHQTVEFTNFLIFKNFTFNLSLTVALSYLIHVLFEKPVLNLLKIVESG